VTFPRLLLSSPTVSFQYFKMGYASAMAWILFVVVMAATLTVFRTSARWVYYGGR